MTLKRKTIAFVILLFPLAVAGLLGLVLRDNGPLRDEGPRDPGPRYKEKSLSEWLALHRWPQARRGAPSEADVAVRSIGTNALPYLLEWIRYELPPWRKALLNLATWDVNAAEGKQIVFRKSLIEGESLRTAERASLGFSILNTNAASALPELETLMKNNQKPIVGQRAIHALAGIGGPAIPVLSNALADINQTNRIDIIYALFAVERGSPPYHRDANRTECMAAVARATNDPDATVRRQAAITLYNLADPDILARLNRGLDFRKHVLQTRTNALLKTPEGLTNAPTE